MFEGKEYVESLNGAFLLETEFVEGREGNEDEDVPGILS